MYKTNIVEINEKINQIKKNKGKAFSNYFAEFNNQKERKFDVLEAVDTIVFGANMENVENEVYRVYFYSKKEDELCELLGQMPRGSIIDYVAKEKGEIDFIEKIGFEKYTLMKRYKISNLAESVKSYEMKSGKNFDFDLELVRFAQNGEEKEIHEILNATFDRKVSHLPSIDDIKKYILQHSIYVYSENGEIRALWILSKEGKKAYDYQILNKAQPKVIHSIWYKGIQDCTSENIQVLEAWIEEKNVQSVRFHEKMGLNFDGLYDSIYIKR